jgi:hypothetical protein
MGRMRMSCWPQGQPTTDQCSSRNPKNNICCIDGLFGIFLNQDLFETDISRATVVTLYLLPELNLKLMPTLKKLKPGTRIVSHSFDMDKEWPPERTQDLSGRKVYY